jgi:exosortase F-associated protein
MHNKRRIASRILIGALAAAGLVAIFLFQRFDFARYWHLADSVLGRFLINRAIRFIANDTLAIALIYALFYERKYVVFAVWVQLAGVVLFLLPYFVLKICFPSYNGPLLSFLHRLILNPTLLLLLIPAFYYQRSLSR